MKIPVEPVSSWQLALWPDDQQIVLRPWVTKAGEADQPAQHFAFSLPVARALHRQLAESIRLLEEQSADAPAPDERRKTQERVSHDRRKTRHLVGSRPSKADRAPD